MNPILHLTTQEILEKHIPDIHLSYMRDRSVETIAKPIAEEIEQSRWIPVSEQLPEPDKEFPDYSEKVLCYDEALGFCVAICFTATHYWRNTNGENLWNVKAWQPIVPPKL